MPDRCHDRRLAELVAVGRECIPAHLHPLVACEFVLGVDPIFANVHLFSETTDGRSYSNTAHAVYPYHQMHRPAADRSPKVVIPGVPCRLDGLATQMVVHELGHILHYRIDFNHRAEPVTEYAKTNRFEAFAEAFVAWVWGDPVDDRTAALFRSL